MSDWRAPDRLPDEEEIAAAEVKSGLEWIAAMKAELEEHKPADRNPQ